MTAELTADMSVAPEIAILAGASPLIPARPPARAGTPGPAEARLTLGALARHLRLLAAAPERWWGLVRFDPERSVRIEVEDRPEYRAWLVVLPPAQAGQQSAGQDCDCEVATVIAGEATEGGPGSTVLRPGSTRVHGQRHRLRGHGAGYSISLHARAVLPASGNAASGNAASGNAGSGNPRPALSQSSARISSSRNVEVIGLVGRGGTFRDVPPERTHPDD